MDHYLAAGSRLAFDLQVRPDICGPLTHNAHTQAIRQHVAWVKTASIVTDLEHHPARFAVKRHRGVTGPGVLGDVIERFLCNTEQGDFDFGW